MFFSCKAAPGPILDTGEPSRGWKLCQSCWICWIRHQIAVRPTMDEPAV